MRVFYVICLFFFGAISPHAQSNLTWSVFIQQVGIYYSSESITAYGYGMGTGAGVGWNNGMAARADINLMWGNGNLVATRLAVGYQQKKHWSPGIFFTTTMLSGHMTEILDDQGQRPSPVAWALGFRVMPLYFKGDKGYVSALELGYGFGDDHGQYAEITLLSVGLKL